MTTIPFRFQSQNGTIHIQDRETIFIIWSTMGGCSIECCTSRLRKTIDRAMLKAVGYRCPIPPITGYQPHRNFPIKRKAI